MDVFENIRLGITDEKLYGDKDYCIQRVKECLRLVNLPDEVGRKLPSELSGGMRKRVGVARAIASQPRYLLWDEPTTGLDPVNADNIDELIFNLGRSLGVTSIVVTHDLDTAFDVGDRIALLYDGKIRANASPADILASEDPVVKQFVRRTRIMESAVA
jgi:phospholipid/cholesterol/gamma-HCH transport system ATP-binding protein